MGRAYFAGECMFVVLPSAYRQSLATNLRPTILIALVLDSIISNFLLK
jgi:hypothetical protein